MKYFMMLTVLTLTGCSTQQELIEENRFQKELIGKKNAQIEDLKVHVRTAELENNMLRDENNALWKNTKSIKFITNPGTFELP